MDTDVLSPLEELARDFLAHCRARRLSPKTIELVYRPRLERLFLPWCRQHGIERPEQVTQRVLDRFGADLAARKLAPASLESYGRSINAFLRWARREGEKISGSLPQPQLPKRIVPTLTPAEYAAMLRVAGPRDRLLLRILWHTGARAGEIAYDPGTDGGLKVGDLIEDGRTSWLLLRRKGRERKVPLPTDVARDLRRYIRTRPDVPFDWVFISERRGRNGDWLPLGVSGLEQMLRLTARRAGIERRVWPHLFRHSFVTRMLARGVDSTVLRRVLGDSSTRMIDAVYLHPSDADIARILDAVSDTGG